MQTLDWNMTTLDGVIHVEQPVTHWLALQSELWLGAALGRSHVTGADGMKYSDSYGGFSAGADVGGHFAFRHSFGLDVTIRYDLATGITDLIGNGHTAGGLGAALAFTYGF